MVKQTYDDLGRRLTALRADFAALGSRAADAASALAAKLPPSPVLLDELSAAREAFTDLRNAVLQQAGALSLVLDVERLSTLRDLEPVLAAIGTAEQRRTQVVAWEKSCEGALVLLDRVMLLIHREERSFAPLAECQARARAMRGVLTGFPPADPERESAMLPDKLRPFTELMALVDGWDTLDDDRCAALQDTIAEAFGRPLALAALRGKLGREGEPAAPAPEPVPRSRGPAEDTSARFSPPAYAPPPPPLAPPRTRPPVGVPSTGSRAYTEAVQAPEPPAAPVASTNSSVLPAIGAPLIRGDGVAGRAPAAPAAGDGGAAPAETSAVVEIRRSNDKISVETPEKQREREALLERLVHEAAPWWVAAREGWKAMGNRGTTFADAARDYVKRFPYLLSVPLQKSAETGGKVAEGYALLLAHIEKQEAGFVRDALTRLNPQFTAGATDQSYQMGQELYLYIVAEGRLYKTYPDFVKEVFVNALPEPGPWVQGRLIESDSETRVVTRGERVGSTQEEAQAVSDRRGRLEPHVFTVTTGPLTSRFFTLTLDGATLADPPDVEVKLKENDAATDHAWLITLPMAGKTEPLAPRKHRPGGTTLPGFGKEFGALWIGIYNADPGSERRYELAITLRRKPPEIFKPGSVPPGKFFGKR
jgi:hypothetical protein